MDSKRKTPTSPSYNGANDSSQTSDDDDSVDSGDDNRRQEIGKGLPTDGYSSFLTSVCYALNAETKTSNSYPGLPPKEKRRLTNRLSARRRRKRRREDLQKLEEDFRRLSGEFEELTAEKANLQKELQEEVAKASAEAETPVPRALIDGLGPTLPMGSSFSTLSHYNHQQIVANAIASNAQRLAHYHLAPANTTLSDFLPGREVSRGIGLSQSFLQNQLSHASLSLPLNSSFVGSIDLTLWNRLRQFADLRSNARFGQTNSLPIYQLFSLANAKPALAVLLPESQWFSQTQQVPTGQPTIADELEDLATSSKTNISER